MLAVPPLPVPAVPGPSAIRPPGRGTVVAVGVISAIIASLITGGLFVTFARPAADAVSTPVSTVDPAAIPPGTTPDQAINIHALLDRAQPSVVTIRTDTSTGSKQSGAAGSGVVISGDGLVLTNAHVVAGASSMTVTLFDGTTQPATLVGSRPENDIAVVQIKDPPTLTPAVLGSSADIKVGDPVVAIGDSLNLGGSPSVTQGIVSGKNREIQTRNGMLTDLIQTDAAINPGNSGGPLLNAAGEVVGINTAIIDNAQNVGFAISIDGIRPQIDEIRNGIGAGVGGDVYLGVTAQSVGDVTVAALDRYHVTATVGAFISDVVTGSGADDSGLQPGDVITSINGASVRSTADISSVIRGLSVGTVVTVEFERAGTVKSAQVKLKSRSASGN